MKKNYYFREDFVTDPKSVGAVDVKSEKPTAIKLTLETEKQKESGENLAGDFHETYF